MGEDVLWEQSEVLVLSTEEGLLMRSIQANRLCLLAEAVTVRSQSGQIWCSVGRLDRGWGLKLAWDACSKELNNLEGMIGDHRLRAWGRLS